MIGQCKKVFEIVKNVPENEWRIDPGLQRELFGEAVNPCSAALARIKNMLLGFGKLKSCHYLFLPVYRFSILINNPEYQGTWQSFNLDVEYPLWPFEGQANLYRFFDKIYGKLKKEWEGMKEDASGTGTLEKAAHIVNCEIIIRKIKKS